MVLRAGELRIDQVPDPTPASGQLIIRSLACCICASDIHMLHHSHRLAEWSAAHEGPFDFDPNADLVLGHEFCGEVVEVGPDCTGAFSPGDRVVSQPLVLHDRGFAVLGYSNRYPGGFAEYLAVSEALLLPVPDHVDSSTAALMEPLSVGIQYARIGNPGEGEVPLVIGCGAIGLAVIAGLRLRGAAPIVAADYSPLRRRLAAAAGADHVVDPTDGDPVAAWHAAAPPGSGCVIWECVGAPGLLNDLFDAAPWGARLIVAGQNLDDDTFFTAAAHTKGLNVQFGGAPHPSDYARALDAIATGAVDVSGWQTGDVDLDGAIAAMDDSTDADRHARITVHPHGLDVT